ncbi:MAG: hypothetical protein SF051_16200, partial [Elusimicrobiota bacterium]|nr:hypothetical protein [Elusimicrobiota bacterium]
DAPDPLRGPDAPAAAGPEPDLGRRFTAALSAALGRFGGEDAAVSGATAPRPEDLAAALSGRADPDGMPPEAAQAARDAKVVGDLLGALGIPPSGAAMPVPDTDAKPPIPIDEATKAALQEEAAAGVAGPATRRFIAEAEKNGYLDLPLYGGRSMRQIMGKARELADQADARAEERRREQAEALGLPPGADHPDKVVPQLLAALRSRDDEAKAYAAARLAEPRYASHPAAVEAIPLLEEVERARKADYEFAEIALRRLRFFKAKRDLDAKSR